MPHRVGQIAVHRSIRTVKSAGDLPDHAFDFENILRVEALHDLHTLFLGERRLDLRIGAHNLPNDLLDFGYGQILYAGRFSRFLRAGNGGEVDDVLLIHLCGRQRAKLYFLVQIRDTKQVGGHIVIVR